MDKEKLKLYSFRHSNTGFNASLDWVTQDTFTPPIRNLEGKYIFGGHIVLMINETDSSTVPVVFNSLTAGIQTNNEMWPLGEIWKEPNWDFFKPVLVGSTLQVFLTACWDAQLSSGNFVKYEVLIEFYYSSKPQRFAETVLPV